MIARYLSLKEVTKRLGVTNAAAYRLPEPDALIESTHGWKPETIDAWNKACPGRGVEPHPDCWTGVIHVR